MLRQIGKSMFGGKLKNLRGRLKYVLAVGVIALVGAGAAVAITKHTGSSTLDCNGAHVDYVSFSSADGNTVAEQLLVNGSVVVTKTFVFNGSNGHDDISFPTSLNGNYTVQVKSSWNTNGHSGSFDSGLKSLGCFTTTTTRTVTGPTVTVTNPTVTVTNPTVTVTNTVTTPAAPPEVRTVTNTVTTPAPPALTVTIIKKVKSPPKIVKVKVPGKAPICKKPKPRKVPVPPSLLPTN